MPPILIATKENGMNKNLLKTIYNVIAALAIANLQKESL